METQPYGGRFEQSTRCRECGADKHGGECPFCEAPELDEDDCGGDVEEELDLG